MSFGFGIGDFITVISAAEKVREDFVAAPAQFKELCDLHVISKVRTPLNFNIRFKILSNILRDLGDVSKVVGDDYLTIRRREDLAAISRSCNAALADTKELVQKPIYVHSQHSEHRSTKTKVRELARRFRWDPATAHDIRDRISLNVGLLVAFNAAVTSDLLPIINQDVHSTKQGVEELLKHKNDQVRRDIEHWLSSDNVSAQQNAFWKERQDGTGQWLLDSSEYRTWIDGTNKTMFCPGIPGAGKTILSSIVINDLRHRFSEDRSIQVVFFYCNYNKEEQSATKMMASLLVQLLQKQKSLPKTVRDAYGKRNEDGFLTLEKLWTALDEAVGLYSRVFVVVDALDECKASQAKALLKHVSRLQKSLKVSFFATARPHVALEGFEIVITFEIQAQDADVERYVAANIHLLSLCVQRSDSLQKEVISAIKSSVKGMFLLAKLHLDSLQGKTSASMLRAALKRLSKGTIGITQAYKRAVELIEAQGSDLTNLAKRTLSWLTFAQRQLTIAELQHALATYTQQVTPEENDQEHIEELKNDFDEDNVTEPEEIIAACAGLVTMDEETKLVRLVHYTTQEYLKTVRGEWLRDAETEITIGCLKYLNFDEFSTGLCPPDSPTASIEDLQLEDEEEDENDEYLRYAPLTKDSKELKARKEKMALFQYVAAYWGVHARSANSTYVSAALTFLANKDKLAASVQVQRINSPKFDPTGGWYSSHPGSAWEADPRTFSACHMVAHFGLAELLPGLQAMGQPLTVDDTIGRTPLMLAADRKHEAVVEELLTKDVDGANWIEHSTGCTPLIYACWAGSTAVMKLLLDKAKVDINKPDYMCLTPLHYAVRGNHLKVVELLLEKGADPDPKDMGSETPLNAAAGFGLDDIVRRLLASPSVDPNSWIGVYGTPLMHAALNNHLKTVTVLLGFPGADSEGYYSKKAISASDNVLGGKGFGHVDMTAVRQVLQAHIDANSSEDHDEA